MFEGHIEKGGPISLGKTPSFLGEKQKSRTNNLNYCKALSGAVILSLRVGVQHVQKGVQ